MTNWKVSCSRESSTRPHINKETINIVLFNLHLSTGLAVHLEEPQFHGSAPKQPGLIPINPSQKAVLIEAAEWKIPHLPKFPKYQTRKWCFPSVQSKAQVKLPRLPVTVLLSGEQWTPTSSACEQSCCPQLLWGQSRRESSVPTQATSSSKIKPWPAA